MYTDVMPAVHIKFFVDGEPLTTRVWHVVPHVKDEVMLGPHGTKTAYRVRRVVFGVEGPEEEHLRQQAVNVDLVEIA